MNKTLLRRLPRLLKKDAVRYGGLLLLIAAVSYIVVATVCASDTTIRGLEANNEKAVIEDGQFTALVELTDDEIASLEEKGITIEKHFGLDYATGDGSVLRVFKNREKMDLVTLIDGTLATKEKQLVLEKNYANAHGYKVGDSLSMDGTLYTVCGIGTTPDYEAVTETLADITEKPMLFGTAFVTPETFTLLQTSNKMTRAVEFVYAYRLNGKMTSEELNKELAAMRFDVEEANNEYLLEAIERGGEEGLKAQEQLEELSSGSGEIAAGASELASAMGELSSNASDLASALGSARSYADLQQADIAAMVANLDESAAAALYYIDEASYVNQSMMSASGSTLSAINAAISALDPSSEAYATIVGQLSNAIAYASTIQSYCSSQQAVIDTARNNVANLSSVTSQVSGALGELSSAIGTLASEGESALGSVSALSGGAGSLADATSQLSDALAEFDENSGAYLNSLYAGTLTKVQEFSPAEDNLRIGSAIEDEDMFLKTSVLLGIFGLLLVSYALGVVLSHILDKEQALIGALYALGVKRRDLTASYLAVPVTVALFGGVLGTVIGLTPLGVGMQMESITSAYSVPELSVNYPIWVILMGILLPPIIAAAVNVFVIRGKLDRPVLDLLGGKPKSAKTISGKRLGKLGFTRMFQARQLYRERRSVVTIVAGMFISLLLVMVGIDCYLMFHNAIDAAEDDITYEYQYLLKYPPLEIPEGGTASYSETLTLENMGADLSITLMGIAEDNPYLSAEPAEGTDRVSISSAMAEKFGLKEGDACIMHDNVGGFSYGFRVNEVFDYDAGFLAVMTIDGMRSLFGQDGTYFNTLMSQKPLDIETGRIYSVTKHADLVQSAQVQFDRCSYTITVFLVMPMFIFAVLLYLLMNVMARNNAMGISLLKIFGYRDDKLHQMYLQGNGFVVIIGAVILIPLSKFIVDVLYGMVLGSSGYTFLVDMPITGYLAVFVLTVAFYFIISLTLRSSIRNIDCDRVLRGRE